MIIRAFWTFPLLFTSFATGVTVSAQTVNEAIASESVGTPEETASLKAENPFDDVATGDDELDKSILGYRKWTDASGSFAIVARFVESAEKSVLIQRKDNGRVVSVPKSKLSDADKEIAETCLQLAGTLKREKSIEQFTKGIKEIVEPIKAYNAQLKELYNDDSITDFVRNKKRKVLKDICQKKIVGKRINWHVKVTKINQYGDFAFNFPCVDAMETGLQSTYTRTNSRYSYGSDSRRSSKPYLSFPDTRKTSVKDIKVGSTVRIMGNIRERAGGAYWVRYSGWIFYIDVDGFKVLGDEEIGMLGESLNAIDAIVNGS